MAKDFYIRLGVDLFRAEFNTNTLDQKEKAVEGDTTQRIISQNLLNKGIKSMFIEGIVHKNTFGPLASFRMRIAHTPHLMIDRRGEIVDLSKHLGYFTNAEGGALGAQGHWFLDGKKIATTRMEAVRFLAANKDVSERLENAIQEYLTETTSFMKSDVLPKDTIKGKATKAKPAAKGKALAVRDESEDEE